MSYPVLEVAQPNSSRKCRRECPRTLDKAAMATRADWKFDTVGIVDKLAKCTVWYLWPEHVKFVELHLQ